MHRRSDVTSLLTAYGRGDASALEELMPILYEQLKSLAHARLRGERLDHTLNTTGLVHEAYLKLVQVRSVEWEDRRHFLAMASTLMRRILVDYARGRRAIKRGGGAPRLQLDEEHLMPDPYADAILELDELLVELESSHPRQGAVVKHHYFAGLDNQEVADVLGVSLSTVERDLRFARAWLARAWKDDHSSGI